MWRNTGESYGSVAVILHWATAAVVFCLFALGLWMTDLSYYDPWYHRAPAIHKSIGVLLLLTVVFRLAWRWTNPRPRPQPAATPFERRASKIAHAGMYALLFAVMLSGYLISSADGRAIDVFGWFDVPATVTGLPNQADLAGDVHLASAVTLVSLVAIHAAGALKHHFLDRDRTLARMFGLRRH